MLLNNEKGYFVRRVDGVVVYFGTRRNKPQLDNEKHAWIPGVNERPDDTYVWDPHVTDTDDPRGWIVGTELVEQKGRLEIVRRLDHTDAGLARVIEDLIDLLEDIQVIDRRDLPQEARDKLAEREQLRSQLS